jgi:hypothetical protein
MGLHLRGHFIRHAICVNACVDNARANVGVIGLLGLLGLLLFGLELLAHGQICYNKHTTYLYNFFKN